MFSGFAPANFKRSISFFLFCQNLLESVRVGCCFFVCFCFHFLGHFLTFDSLRWNPKLDSQLVQYNNNNSELVPFPVFRVSFSESHRHPGISFYAFRLLHFRIQTDLLPPPPPPISSSPPVFYFIVKQLLAKYEKLRRI